MICCKIADKEYQEHAIFNELEQYSQFYDFLSYSIFGWFNMGVQGFNFESQFLNSMQGTIKSIKILLENKTINDAYALTRKYYDSIVIHIYANLYLEDNFSLENFVVEKINNWLEGKEKLPTYSEMNQYLNSHIKLETINKLLKEKKDINLRQRLNDHTHYNYFQYMILNNSGIVLNAHRMKALDQLSNDLKGLFIKHFIWLFTIKDHYMMSSDYIDYLDCGETPPEGVQYDVASFVQEAFDNIIKIHREDLAIELKNSTCMNLL